MSEPKKNKFVQDLTEGEQINELFLVKSVRKGETRAGKPYLALTFSDKSGEISGPAWDNVEKFEALCVPGTVVRVCGIVQTYRDKPQLKVDTIQAIDQQSCSLGDYIEASQRDFENMKMELEQVIGAVKNPYLNKLLNQVFKKSDTGDLFATAPAAKGIHHAYLGGLLEHSLSMARVAGLLAGHYSFVDRDLLVTGALLHDIGKTEELHSDTGVIDYTDNGRLKGHLVMGCEFISRAAARIKGFPADLLTHIQHLVLSHHGRQEFGSPVVPMTAEALLLSFVDDMDAKMNLVEQLSRKSKSESPQWSDYQRSLERYLYIRPLAATDERPLPDDGEDSAAVKQRSLF